MVATTTRIERDHDATMNAGNIRHIEGHALDGVTVLATSVGARSGNESSCGNCRGREQGDRPSVPTARALWRHRVIAGSGVQDGRVCHQDHRQQEMAHDYPWIQMRQDRDRPERNLAYDSSDQPP